MAQCTICGKEVTFFNWIRAPQIKRCKECDIRLTNAQQYWINIIERAFMSGGVSEQIERDLYGNFQALQMPPDLAQQVIQRLKYLRMLSEIQWGNVPVIHIDIHIDSDEVPHFSMMATYHKQNKQVRLIPGRLVGTSKKMYFISHTGKDSMTVDWNNIVKVDAYPFNKQTQSQLIQIQVAKGAGGGYYTIADSLYTKTIIDTLVRLWKRQLVLYKEQKNYGEIPQHIKVAVFQRDEGKCIQCGYSGEYLEYDHKIPRSKGGTNALGNIQLLCRGCNLKKGNRV